MRLRNVRAFFSFDVVGIAEDVVLVFSQDVR